MNRLLSFFFLSAAAVRPQLLKELPRLLEVESGEYFAGLFFESERQE